MQLRQFVAAHVARKREQQDAAGAYTSSLSMHDIIHELPDFHQNVLIERQRSHLDRIQDILSAGSEAGHFRIDDIGVTAFADMYPDPAASM